MRSLKSGIALTLMIDKKISKIIKNLKTFKTGLRLIETKRKLNEMILMNNALSKPLTACQLK